jgi:hypothetical protein
MMIKIQPKLVLALLALVPVTILAQTVNVDFSRDITGPNPSPVNIAGALHTSTGPAPDTGTLWNDFKISISGLGDTVVAGDTRNNLLDSTGAATTIDVSLTSGFYRAFNSSTTTINDLQQEWVFAQSGLLATMTVGGLNSWLTYDLYLVTPGVTTIPTAYTIGATTKSATGAAGTGGIWTAGTHYVLFSGITPDSGGNIAIGIQDGLAPITGNGGIAAMQIVAVPEPSTSMILISSFVGLGIVLRRRF